MRGAGTESALVAAIGALVLFSCRAFPAGTISGTVRDPGGYPISSVWVDGYDANNNWLDSGFTDGTGAYSITNLPNGNYFARTFVVSGDYVDEWYDNIPATGTEIPSQATPLSIVNGGTVTADFVLSHGGTITGRVTDIALAPLADVWVDAYGADGSRRKSALTATNGAYALAGLPEETLFLRTDTVGRNYVDEWYNNVPATETGIPLAAQGLVVVAGTVTGAMDFALSAGAAVRGRVSAASGAPLSNIWVDVYTAGGEWTDGDLSQTNGRYGVTGLPAGTYYARTYSGSANYADEWYNNVPVSGWTVPTNATPLNLSAGSTSSNVDFVLALGGGISGTVTNEAGVPLRAVGVDLYGTEGDWVKSAETDTLGAYSVRGLPASAYHIRTSVGATNYADEWFDNIPVTGTAVPSGATALNVTTGLVVQRIDFGLREGGLIAGSVALTNGAPLGNVAIHVYDSATNWVRSSATASNGSYRVQGLPAPGSFYVTADAGALNCVSEWYDDVIVGDGWIPEGAELVPVLPGVTATGIDFALAAGGSVSGLVTDVQAVPLPGVRVGLYASDSNRLWETWTGPEGTYGWVGVPAGSFYLRTEAGTMNYVDEWFRDVPALGWSVPPAATALPVSAGSVTGGIDFALARAGGLAGRVTGTGAAPLAGIAIDVYDGNSNWVNSTATGTGGVYQIYGLATQTVFYVRTYAGPRNYLDEWYDNAAAAGTAIPAGADPVRVTGGLVTGGIDFALAEGGILSGSVGDGAGSPLTGIAVEVYDTNGTWVISGDTDGVGWYRIQQLAAGNYLVRTYSGARGFVDEWYNDVNAGVGDIPSNVQSLALGEGTSGRADFGLGFSVVQSGMTNGYFGVIWQAASGTTYRVRRSDDLDDPMVWSNAPSGSLGIEQSLRTAASQDVLKYRDPTVPTNGHFYRVDIEP